LVSHQLDKVAEMCTSAILLQRGEVVMRGAPEDCIAKYLAPPEVEDEEEDSDRAVLDFPFGNRVASGERIVVRAETEVPADVGEEEFEPLAFLLRNSRTGAIVTVVGTAMCGLELPSGRSRVEASLQLNVPPGVYALEAFAYDRRASRTRGRGSAGVVVVEPGKDFKGQVQLNADLTLLSPESDGG
ncbi:MAG: hypothetical protein AAF389_18620, partial [Gemmatimonadota bacterium]